MATDVLIIGGGPAGLAAALWEQRDGARVTVLEASARPGGWVCSERRDGYLCEHGPQAIRSTSKFLDFVAMAGLQDGLVAASPESSTRWVGRRGKLRAVPTKPLAMLGSGLLSLRGKLRLLRESKVVASGVAAGGESVAAFCERRFGPETVPLVEAMLGGIFAGDARRLEVATAMPILPLLERQHGSVLRGVKALRQRRRERGEAKSPPEIYTFENGIEGLVNGLAAAVGDSLETSAPVASVAREGDAWVALLESGEVRRASRLLLACPARVSARLLQDAAPELADELTAIPFVSLASVFLGLPIERPPRKLIGFGFLLEQDPDVPVLGAIYASQLFPDHAPAGHQLVRVMMGGALQPGLCDKPDQELIELARTALRRYAGVTTAPTMQHVVRCRDAIPQYELGHDRRLRTIASILPRYEGLGLIGNSYHGVAVTAQLKRGAGMQPGGATAAAAAGEVMSQ